MSELQDDILRLRGLGMSYRDIQKELNCSKSTIAYYLSDQEKEKSRQRQHRLRQEKPLLRKVETFQSIKKGQQNKAVHFHREGKEYTPINFNYSDAVEYLDGKYVCYLTGDLIDLNDPTSYSFDHIVPVAKGGTNELHNLGLTTRDANMAKSDLTLEEFVDLCVKVAKHYGRI